MAASPRASPTRCWKRSSTTRPAISSPPRWRTTCRRPRAKSPPIEIHHLETMTRSLHHQSQGTGRGRRDRRAGRGRQRHQRCAFAVRRIDRRVSGDAATHPRGAALGLLARRRDMSFVGRSVPRLEDRPLVTAAGRFAADIAFPHMLHMRVVRSAHAHGRIRSIDTRRGAGAAGRRRGLDVCRRRATFRRSISG